MTLADAGWFRAILRARQLNYLLTGRLRIFIVASR